MFDEPEENPSDRVLNPAELAKDKSDEFRMHAEIAAVFEGPRKFDAELRLGLDPEIARDVQRAMARLEKSKITDTPIIATEIADEAIRVLTLPDIKYLSTNDYHIYRRPGELMIVRWLSGEQVDSFYERLQAHFDAALEGFREEERSARQWKQDPKILAYLEALDKVEIKMADRYLRDTIRQHKLFILSTQTADELNISYLSDYVMGMSQADLVGPSTTDEPTPDDAWFFKLFSLRGIINEVEKMCFFAFLQKSDDSF